jgi:hypothetical protein
MADALDADLVDRQMAGIGAALYVCDCCDGIHGELSVLKFEMDYTKYPTLIVGQVN